MNGVNGVKDLGDAFHLEVLPEVLSLLPAQRLLEFLVARGQEEAPHAASDHGTSSLSLLDVLGDLRRVLVLHARTEQCRFGRGTELLLLCDEIFQEKNVEVNTELTILPREIWRVQLSFQLWPGSSGLKPNIPRAFTIRCRALQTRQDSKMIRVLSFFFLLRTLRNFLLLFFASAFYQLQANKPRGHFWFSIFWDLLWTGLDSSFRQLPQLSHFGICCYLLTGLLQAAQFQDIKTSPQIVGQCYYVMVTFFSGIYAKKSTQFVFSVLDGFSHGTKVIDG